MQSQAEQLASLPKPERDEILSDFTDAQIEALLYDWRGFNARPDQVAPDGDWDIWLALAGRGFGKTRMGSEWIREEVAAGRMKRIALVAETSADARDVLVEGDSGILAVHPEHERPLYEPSKRRLTWANGAVATLFNATEPDQLRGPQFDGAWCDELAKWDHARETWDMLQFGLRLGEHPKVLVTTTPRPIELVKALLAGQEGKVAVTRGRTLDNAANLAAPFMEKIINRYQGTRLGRQELDGDVLGDLPGALWTLASIDGYRMTKAPENLGRILVSVDPAVTANEDSDEHGIIVGGMTDEQTGVVLQDASLQGSPMAWAKRAVSLAKTWEADGIVVEVNQGGDMVKQTIRAVDQTVKIIEVRASRGKHVRAEPIAALYEQGRIAHVGSYPELEDQMTQMTAYGYEGEKSPDRLDALVWLMSELFPGMTQRKADLSAMKPPRMRSGGWLGA